MILECQNFKNLKLVAQLGRILLTVLGGRGFQPCGKKLHLPCLVLGSGGGLQMGGGPTEGWLANGQIFLSFVSKVTTSQFIPLPLSQPIRSLYPFMPPLNHPFCHVLSICTSVSPSISFFNFHPFFVPFLPCTRLRCIYQCPLILRECFLSFQ